MIDAQLLKSEKFTSKKTGMIYYNNEVLIPSLGVLLPFMTDTPFPQHAKGKAIFGLTMDRKALRITDFQPAA